MTSQKLIVATALLLVAASALEAAPCRDCGKTRANRQPQNDLFYNAYVGPSPCGTAAQMYLSPQPVPAHTGHTYVTYQPLMPHQMMHAHMRSNYTRHADAGWTRTSVRYRSFGSHMQAASFGLFDDTLGGWLQGANFKSW